jgi:hypothetical protein
MQMLGYYVRIQHESLLAHPSRFNIYSLAIQLITFKPVASITLKWLRLKFLRWLHYLQHSVLPSNGLGLFTIVRFPWLNHVPFLADGTMETQLN